MTFLPPIKYLHSLKTPLCIYQTRRGTIQHLTSENQTDFELGALMLSLGDFFHLDKVLSQFPEHNFTIQKFLGFQNKICILSPIDTFKKCVEGMNKKTSVKINTIKGFEELSIDNFLKTVSLIKPDVLVALTEEPLSDGSAGYKSHNRCVDKTIEFLDYTIASLKKLGHLEHMDLIGSIQGGSFEDLRQKSIVETISRDEIKGIMIYGLYEGETFSERTNIFKKLMGSISKERYEKLLVMIHGKGEPIDILHGLSHGIDCFEVDYPFYLADNGSAFCFERFDFIDGNLDNEERTVPEAIFDKKRAKVIDLVEEKFEMDKGPILQGCGCYSCNKHTRAYIHHLLKSKEMTAHVLLTIHNLHTFEGFFKNAKDSIALKLFPQYVSWFLKNQAI